MSRDDELWEVELSRDALFVYLRIEGGRQLSEVDGALDMLARFPRAGHVYDPLYEAARTPFEMRVAFAGHYGIYYETDDARRTASVLFIEDERRNPEDRFANVVGFYGR